MEAHLYWLLIQPYSTEPDDPANFTTTTEEYKDTITSPGGRLEKTVTKTREVKTYTGPTLDVKDELISLRKRATQQDAIIAQMTTLLKGLGADVSTLPVPEDAAE